MKHLIITFIILILAAAAARAKEEQGPGASFHDRVAATYNFLPRNLNQKAIDAKSKELDVLQIKLRHKGPR